MIYAADDSIGPGGIEEVDLPPGMYGEYMAFKVRGDSNYPAYRDSEIIFVRKEGGPPDEFVNRECVLQTIDGRRLLKTLTQGSKRGHFTLISFNAPPMVDERRAPLLGAERPQHQAGRDVPQEDRPRGRERIVGGRG